MVVTLIIFTLALFFVAALLEIFGGYLTWRWLRFKKTWLLGIMGGLLLFGYGIILTLQPANFGRVYAAYGGIFIVSSIIWGFAIDKKRPDRYEIIGGIITLIGALIIFFTTFSVDSFS